MKRKHILALAAVLIFSTGSTSFAKTYKSSKTVAKAVVKPVVTSAPCPASKSFNVAVVDVQKVVENSKQISSLRTEQQQKIADLQKFVENARKDVEKEKNADKKKALEDGYNKELNVRKNAIDSDYVQKLSVIEKDILATIESKAKALNYDLVLVKNNTLYGGVDITDAIIDLVK